MLASSTSWCWTTSIARSSAWQTRSSPPSAWCSSCASSSWNCCRVVSGIALTDLAGDVGLGALVARVGKDRLGLVELDHPAGAVAVVLELDGEEGGHVRDARRLLHVVRDDHDRVAL